MSPVPDRLTAALAARYEVRDELGHGGMATVYLAADRKHHREVAIKVLRADLAASLGAERFLKEIEILTEAFRRALLRAFVGTARDFQGSEAALQRDLEVAERMADDRLLPFSRADLHAYLEQMRARGYPAVEHSPGYEAAYRPAYRVALRSLVP